MNRLRPAGRGDYGVAGQGRVISWGIEGGFRRGRRKRHLRARALPGMGKARLRHNAVSAEQFPPRDEAESPRQKIETKRIFTFDAIETDGMLLSR